MDATTFVAILFFGSLAGLLGLLYVVRARRALRDARDPETQALTCCTCGCRFTACGPELPRELQMCACCIFEMNKVGKSAISDLIRNPGWDPEGQAINAEHPSMPVLLKAVQRDPRNVPEKTRIAAKVMRGLIATGEADKILQKAADALDPQRGPGVQDTQ